MESSGSHNTGTANLVDDLYASIGFGGISVNKLMARLLDEYRKEHEEEDFEVIRSKEFYLQAISVNEAILQMNLIGHQFFIFENADTNLVSVVYRRNDGKYGLIETK